MVRGFFMWLPQAIANAAKVGDVKHRIWQTSQRMLNHATVKTQEVSVN
jgi:hypothetical protein